jgi:CHAT domain-containing protein
LQSLLAAAEQRALAEPQVGLALARVAHAEAGRLNNSAIQASADYALAACLNRADAWTEALFHARQARNVFDGLGNELAVARCDWQAAFACRYLAQYEQGVLLARRAERVFRDHGDDLWLGRALLEKARNLNQADQLEQAFAALGAARPFLAQYGRSAEMAHYELAQAALIYQTGDLRPAVEAAERAGRIFSQLGRRPDTAWALYLQGFIASVSQDFENAVELLEYAAHAFAAMKLPFREALALNQFGSTLIDQGRFAEAGRLLEPALGTFERLLPGSLYSGMARANLGVAAGALGDLEKAAAQLEAGRAVFARLRRPAWLAWVEGHLGRLDRERGRYDRAASRLEAAAQGMRQVGAGYDTALAEEELAELYLAVGDFGLAGGRLGQCLEYYRRTDRPVDVARAEILLAQALIGSGEPRRALEHLQAASTGASAPGCEWLAVQAEYTIGRALAQMGNYDEAELRLGLAAEMAGRLRLRSQGAAAALLRAELWQRHGNRAEVARILEDAFAGWQSPPAELQWRREWLLAKQAPEGRQALAGYRRAIAAMQPARRSLPREELAAVYFLGRRAAFDEAIALALRLGDPRAALEVVEECRAQALARRLRAAHWEPAQEAPRPAGGTRPAARTAHSRQRRAQPGRAWGSSAAREATPPESAVLPEPADWKPFGLESFWLAARHSLPAGWRGLAYHQLGDDWLVFEISQPAVRASRLHLSANDRRLIAQAAAPEGKARATLLRAQGMALRRRLYDLLIPRSTAKRLAQDQLLLILPYGPLNTLPFHALQAPGGQFLIEQTTVGYAPSLLTLELLPERAESDAGREPSLLIAAYEAGGSRAGELLAASREVERLQRVFGRGAVCLEGENATGSAVRALSRSGRLAEFEFLHLIAHGEFHPGNARRSRLLLADGGLSVDDVADLRLNARVVTISACEGGLREVHAGEEWVGLTQAFLAAGARSVIGGLWGLPDRAMPWLMRLIYEHLLAGQGAALALSHAQRKLLQIHREPYYWAALTAVGLP